MTKIILRVVILIMPIALFGAIFHKFSGGSHNISQTVRFAERQFSFDFRDFTDDLSNNLQAIKDIDWSPPNIDDLTWYDSVFSYFTYFGKVVVNFFIVCYRVLAFFYFLIEYSFSTLFNLFQVIRFYLF